LAFALTGARASDGTISFTGAVTGNSCTVHVGTDHTAVVALPVVDAAALSHSSPSDAFAAGTFFAITLGGCIASQADISGTAPSRVAIYFEADPGVDQTTHALINAGSSNVQVKLYLASGNNIVGKQITPGTAGSGQPASQPVSDTTVQHFYAGYSLPNGVQARAGTVNAAVTWSLVYD
jgi:major type 1 subunit fimbrin (pilin)